MRVVYVLLGAGVGAAVAVGVPPVLAAALLAPMTAAVGGLLGVVAAAVEPAVAAVPGEGARGAVETVVHLLLPGSVALLLVLAARAGDALRRVAAMVLAGAAVAVLVLSPVPHPVVAAVVLAAFAGLVGMLGGVVAVAPAVALATFLTVDTAALLLAGEWAADGHGGHVLSQLPGAQGLLQSEPLSLLAHLSALLVAALPFLVAAGLLWRYR